MYKITRSSQGWRIKRPEWEEGKWYDVYQVGKIGKPVRVVDDLGRTLYFDRSEEDTDWAVIGPTPKPHKPPRRS